MKINPINTMLIIFTAAFVAVMWAQGPQAALALGERTLYWGMRGRDVSELQWRLQQKGYYLKVDGIYGSRTVNVVKAFQRHNRLKVDGVAGPQTIGALTGRRTTAAAARGAVSTSGDVGALARIIYGEARGEPYIGQVAVGAVVLNRVEHPSFPNSIAGVIFQPGAFDAVSDGQYWLNPDAEAAKAARDALSGWDPTWGALYYWNPATATSRWIWSRPIQLRIGKHVFAR